MQEAIIRARGYKAVTAEFKFGLKANEIIFKLYHLC